MTDNETRWFACPDPSLALLHLGTWSAYTHEGMTGRQLRLWVEACQTAIDKFTYLHNKPLFDWGEIKEGSELLVPYAREMAELEYSEWISLQERADLLREIVGNPYRRTVHSGSKLYKRNPVELVAVLTPEVVTMASKIYFSSDFDILPVLADLMEDAGCSYGELLDHLRGPNNHVPGCWALDTILNADARWG